MKLASLFLVLMLAVPFPSAHAQSAMKHDNKASAGTEHKASGKVTKVDTVSYTHLTLPTNREV